MVDGKAGSKAAMMVDGKVGMLDMLDLKTVVMKDDLMAVMMVAVMVVMMVEMMVELKVGMMVVRMA